MLILVDGHRIGTGNAAKLNVDRIERIEVTKGPASALYGSAAIGGVINLITKKGDGDPSAILSGDYGSFDYYKGQISGGGEVNGRFRFHATASYEDIGDYDDPEFGTVYNTGETKKNFGMNLSYAFTPNHESVAWRIANLAGNRDMEDGVYLDGGSASNRGLVAAIEDELFRDVHVLPYPQFTVAYGAARSL